ncbi:MAG: hypothetical protein ABWZ40_00970, partial [Caulobacterales bacterium]
MTIPTPEAAIAEHAKADPGFFLSPRNPIATRDQIDVQAKAIAMMQSPLVLQARGQAANRWRIIAGARLTAEAESRLDELVEEYCFCYALKAVNGDANYPRVTAGLYNPGHQWFGLTVPGSRGAGGDGPDQNYSFLPIDYGGHFELRGQRLCPEPADTTYTLTGSLGFTMTLGNIEGRDLITDPDGRFVITISPEPANGNPNHLQTAPNARYVFVRECRSDWRQSPAIHRIVRTNAPTMPPLTDAQLEQRTAQFIVDDVCSMFWLSAYMQSLEANVMGPVINSGAVGGLTSQRIGFARLKLDADHAFVIRVGGRDAPFRDIVAHDFWFRTFDYWRRTSNLNNSQTRLGADGAATYVVAMQDPGVHNWIDTAGFSETLLVHRWQGFPPGMTDA